MIGLNVVWVFSPDCKKVLMCNWHKEPFKGLYKKAGGDEKELVWLDTTEDFFDYSRFAGEGNIGHIFEVIKRFRDNEVQNV